MEAVDFKFRFTYDEYLGLKFPFPWLVTAGSCALYLLLTFVIWPATRPVSQEAIEFWRTARSVHNRIMLMFSAACVALWGWWLFVEHDYRPWRSDMFCVPVTGWAVWVTVVFQWSKIIEWADTMFLVYLKPGSLSFLHVYHHATTFWMFLLVANVPAGQWGGWWNSVAHGFMYWHYWRPWPKSLVPFITFFQISHLLYVIYGWSMGLITCPGYRGFPSKYPLETYTPYLGAPVYVIFFVRYFIERYIWKVREKPKEGKKRKGQ